MGLRRLRAVVDSAAGDCRGGLAAAVDCEELVMIYCEYCGAGWENSGGIPHCQNEEYQDEHWHLTYMPAPALAAAHGHLYRINHIRRCPACKLFDQMQEQGKRIEDLARGMRAIQQVQWRLEKGD